MAGWGNSFSLLDEDESGEGIVRTPVKAAAPAAAKPAKEEPKAANKNAAVADNKDSGRKPERQQRPPRAREERRGEESAEQQQQSQQQQQAGAALSTNVNNERAFARSRNPERTGGERRERRDNGAAGAPGGPRGPRQFDRRSGTGRGREDKRGGAGRGGWGSDEQEIKEQTNEADPGDASVLPADNADADWAAAKNQESWGAPGASAATEQGEGGQAAQAKEERPPREQTEEEKARQAEREAEAKLMTLDEYLNQKKKLDYQLPAPRQAGEGEDSKQWAQFVAVKSDKSTDEDLTKPLAKKAERQQPQQQGAKKVPLPAELLRFKGEQQRRDNERRERGPREGGSYERRERAPRGDGEATRGPRANNYNGNNQQQQQGGKRQADFAAGDFPSLKA